MVFAVKVVVLCWDRRAEGFLGGVGSWGLVGSGVSWIESRGWVESEFT